MKIETERTHTLPDLESNTTQSLSFPDIEH